MPREACVDVARELGTDPSIFFKPPCVAVHRCVTLPLHPEFSALILVNIDLQP